LFVCLFEKESCQLLGKCYVTVIYKYPYCKFKQLHSDFTQHVMCHIYRVRQWIGQF